MKCVPESQHYRRLIATDFCCLFACSLPKTADCVRWSHIASP